MILIVRLECIDDVTKSVLFMGGGLVGVAPHLTRQFFFSTDFDIFVSQKNQYSKKDSTDSEPDGEETHKKKIVSKTTRP